MQKNNEEKGRILEENVRKSVSKMAEYGIVGLQNFLTRGKINIGKWSKNTGLEDRRILEKRMAEYWKGNRKILDKKMTEFWASRH
jgi:hypothetical protein